MVESLSDAELVIRRFDPGKRDNTIPPIEDVALLFDQATGERRLTSYSLRWDEDLPGVRACSVYRESVLFADGLGRGDVLEDPSWLIGVAEARRVRLAPPDDKPVHVDVVADPLPTSNPSWHPRDNAHALITLSTESLDLLSKRAQGRVFSAIARAFVVEPLR